MFEKVDTVKKDFSTVRLCEVSIRYCLELPRVRIGVVLDDYLCCLGMELNALSDPIGHL